MHITPSLKFSGKKIEPKIWESNIPAKPLTFLDVVNIIFYIHFTPTLTIVYIHITVYEKSASSYFLVLISPPLNIDIPKPFPSYYVFFIHKLPAIFFILSTHRFSWIFYDASVEYSLVIPLMCFGQYALPNSTLLLRCFLFFHLG